MNTFTSRQQTARNISIFHILELVDKLTQTLRIERIFSRFILLLVRGYQLYLSPYKGFSCAYRKLHNGQSCSSYFYSCVSSYGLSTASIMLRQRFHECTQASHILQAQTNHRKQTSQRRKNNDDSCPCCTVDFALYDSGTLCGDIAGCGDDTYS